MLRCGKNLDRTRERGVDRRTHALGASSVLAGSASTVTRQEQTGVAKPESSFWRLRRPSEQGGSGLERFTISGRPAAE